MFDFLKRKKKTKINPDRVADEDAMMREVVSRCFNEGRVIVGNRIDDETFETYPLNDKNDKKICKTN